MRTAALLFSLALLSTACRKGDDPWQPVDLDGDGFLSEQDCDETDPTVFPGAPELCDQLDNDCDGEVDEDPEDATVYYTDADGDGYGVAWTATRSCVAPEGATEVPGDCDDGNADWYPGAPEAACSPHDTNCDGQVDWVDADADGWAACAGDCDDNDPLARPGGVEVCDGIDNDCDGTVDVGAADGSWWYADADGDTYGDPLTRVVACDAPDDHVADGTDCDDTLPAVHPTADEHCDGVDEDCDGLVDDGAVDMETGWRDADGDGYGDDLVVLTACELPSTYVSTPGDCDDTAAAAHPTGIEVCDGLDNDCDGTVDMGATDPATWYTDADGDGYGDATSSTSSCAAPAGTADNPDDCDDTSAAVSPAQREVCDGVDNDCDGTTDASAIDAPTWYADADGDGYGVSTTTQRACEAPTGYAAARGDCDDANPDAHPVNVEVCDGVDNDCDGDADSDALDRTTWYTDADADGFGLDGTEVLACTAPAGTADRGGDCDDAQAAAHPYATEICDGIDNDCSGDADSDALDRTTWYTDADADGFGLDGTEVLACTAPAGTVDRGGDCDDAQAAAHPYATEVCDGIDNDCNGDADSDAVDRGTWYTDADADGFGVGSATLACSAPAGTAGMDGDCDDAQAAVNPSAPEVCDGLDNDCDGTTDTDAAGRLTWYADADADGYGLASDSTVACSPTGAYTSLLPGDCDDAAAAAHPGATEVCDSLDNDCDGDTDGGAVNATAWYTDGDTDGWGAGAATLACSAPAGTVDVSGDCDDGAAGTHPGADEWCDAADNDCDGSVDEGALDADAWYPDGDGDGYGVLTDVVLSCSAVAGHSTTAGDCDDTTSAASPAGSETCDTLDNDCNGVVDDGASDATVAYPDVDGDGFGDSRYPESFCGSLPTGYVLDGTDCDDLHAEARPGGLEVCDGTDNDCNGVVDDDALVLGDGEECPALSCEDLITTRTLDDGIYWVQPGASAPFETWCDMTTDGGGWTLVLSVNDDSPQRSADHPSQKWQMTGVNHWQDQETFGSVYTVTSARTGSYKNPAYWELQATDVLIYHTPNGTPYDAYHNDAIYAYYTDSGFLSTQGGTLYDLYVTYHPLVKASYNTGYAVAATWTVGSASGLWSEQNPSNEGETTAGYITFSHRNNEGYPMAMCPGVRYNGGNSEHSCIGGNGQTGGRGRGGWGNLREWTYSSDWGYSTRMKEAAILVFTR